MDGTKVFEVSVKDYAEQRGKTVQAVYQQMKRKENAMALNGHVRTRRIGNREVKFLDEKAVEILDNGSHSTPTIIEQTDLKNELEAKETERKRWEAQAFMLQGKIDLLKELLDEKDAKLLQLAAPEEQINALKGENARLSADNEELGRKVTQANKTAQEANAEAWRHYRVALEIYNDLPWWKKRRRNAPEPPKEKE